MSRVLSKHGALILKLVIKASIALVCSEQTGDAPFGGVVPYSGERGHISIPQGSLGTFEYLRFLFFLKLFIVICPYDGK